jgi:chaperonin GroEL
VVRFALQNAASVAGLVLATAAMVAERMEEDPSRAQEDGRGGMGAMGM